MSDTLLGLGRFRFGISTAAYHRLQQSYAYRWPSQARLLAEPGHQFVGAGVETLSLDGVIYPHMGPGVDQVAQLHALAGQGEPLLLVDGVGYVWGRYVIVSLHSEQQFFLQDGRPRKQTFQLSLSHYGEDA